MAKGAIGMRVKFAFFDSKPVMRKLSPKKRKFLSKFGSFVRERARDSIKKGGKKNKTSDPGKPPRSHGNRNIKRIFFGYDFRNDSVVIGPIVIPTESGGPTALEAIEEGGTTSIITGFGNQRKSKRIRLQARPFMGPAFEEEKKIISTIWKSS